MATLIEQARSHGSTPVPQESSNGVAQKRSWLLLAALFAVSLVPIWVTAHFPSQNGPWFLLPTHMFTEYDNPAFNYAEYYVRNWHPIPHLLHDALVGLGSSILPLLTSEKIILSLYVLLLPLSVFYLLSVVAPHRTELGFLSFLMIHNYPFYRGYHDFTLSIPLFFFALGYWLKHRERFEIRQASVAGGLAVLVYLSHLFTFALLAGCIGWIRLFETRRWKPAFAAAIAVTWPGWLLTADYLWLNSQASWINQSDTEWLPLHWTVEYFVRQFFYTVSFPAYVIALLAWSWIPLLLLIALRSSREKLSRILRAVLTNPFASLVLFLGIAYLCLPYKFIGWHKVDIRLVPFILVLLLAAVAQIPNLPLAAVRMRKLFVSSVAVALASVVALLTPHVLRMEALLAEYLSGIEHFEPNSTLLAVHQENPSFGVGIRPLTRAHEYYHIARGGANGQGLAGMNTLAMMWYRTYPVDTRFPKYDPNRPDESMQRIAEAYDYVLCWGEAPELFARLEDHPDFRVVHQRGKLRLYRNAIGVP